MNTKEKDSGKSKRGKGHYYIVAFFGISVIFFVVWLLERYTSCSLVDWVIGKTCDNGSSKRVNIILLGSVYISTIGLLAFFLLWQRTKNQEEQLDQLIQGTKNQKEQIETQNQIYAQTVFNDAIKNLNDGNEQVRMSSVYYFEKMLDVQKDAVDEKTRRSIFSILCRDVIIRSKKKRDSSTQLAGNNDNLLDEIQKVLDFLFMRETRASFEKMEANFNGANLKGALLNKAHLERARFEGAHLEGANLSGAHLEEANLIGAHLERARFEGAHLERASLVSTHLERANLSRVHLDGAWLSGAHLEGANLSGAHLDGANLKGVGLDGAYFYKASIKDIFIDQENYNKYFKEHYGDPMENKDAIDEGQSGAYWDNIMYQRIAPVTDQPFVLVEQQQVIGVADQRVVRIVSEKPLNDKVALEIYNDGRHPNEQLKLEQFIKMSRRELGE